MKIPRIVLIIGASAVGLFLLLSYFHQEKRLDPASSFRPSEYFRDRRTEAEPPSSNLYFSHFPARLEDFAVPPKMYGIWPYGIRGGNSNSHSEGHPGWDFELKKGSKLYAVTDLRISQIHDGDKQVPGMNIQVIEAGAILNNKPYGIVYHSVINLEPGVVEGATIRAGSPLAEVGFPLSDTSAMIHFGVFAPKDSIGSCPTPYFSAAAREILAKVVAQSRDYFTGLPYESACVGKISRQIYEQNFPDRLQYLQGGEPWE